ncbi:MAG: hypothetical protein IH997_08915 [Proteobacteria bacterium]|nr:hypothetical protein [Pseudomonadota bacterium]
MKTGGIHIVLCCEHCDERVPKVMAHSFPCPACQKKCEPNGMVAESLLNIGKQMQAMSPEEQLAMLRKSRGLDATR